jgi:putative transposase
MGHGLSSKLIDQNQQEERTMTHQLDDTLLNSVCELLDEYGFDGLAEAMTIVLNEAMKVERARHLQAAPYERTEERRGYANGFKPKTVRSRIGALNLAVPQVREGDFYPASLEKGLRSERALKLALAEMYVQGVSTRKVAEITEQLCGFAVTSAEVSRAAQALDEQLAAWRDRPLGAYPYVYLDARYEKVRHSGLVIDVAVLLAAGVRADGYREVLGCSVSLSEQEVHWRDFLRSLKDRGLHGIKLFISDAHEGLKAARKALFPAVPWQRCQFHLQRNAVKYVPRRSLRGEVAEELRTIFNAPDVVEAQRYLEQFLAKYEQTAPDLAQWAESAIPEGLTVFAFERSQRRRLRTSNMLERLSREIKRRTRVATLFPNPASCLRLVTAVVMEISEEWQTGKRYLSFEESDLQS